MKVPGPIRAETTVAALEARAAATPDAPAFAAADGTLTYGELREQALRVAAALVDLGVEPGDRVPVALPSGLDFVRALLGAQAAGAAPVPVNPGLAPELLLRRFQHVRARVAIAGGALAGALAGGDGVRVVTPGALEDAARRGRTASAAAVGPTSIAYLLFTSGTTGDLKAARVAQASLVAWLRAYEAFLGVRADDVFLAFVAPHQGLGLVRFVFAPLFLGRPAHLVATGLHDVRAWLEAATRVRATVTAAPVLAYRVAARLGRTDGIDLASLRFAPLGGEPVRAAVIEAFEHRFGVPGVIRPAYGLTEATAGVTNVRPGEPLVADAAGHVACGRPFDGVTVQVVGPAGEVLPAGEPGDILVRGPGLFAGYLDDEAATRIALRDGWLHTSDVGYLDAEGRLYVLGRRRAMIKRAGLFIAPVEVERAAEAVPGVLAAAAVPLAAAAGDGSEDFGVMVEAVLADAAADGPAIARAVSAAIARAVGVAPGDVFVTPPSTLPRTPDGKVRADEVQRCLARAAPAVRRTAP